MLATLSVQNRVMSRLRDLGISASNLAGLTGLTNNRMSDFLRGRCSLGVEKETELVKLLDDLILLRDATRPFLLPITDVPTMRRLLEYFRRTEISPEFVAENIAAMVGASES